MKTLISKIEEYNGKKVTIKSYSTIDKFNEERIKL